jgi:aminopeptidase-like protein
MPFKWMGDVAIMDALIRDLCSFPTAVVADGNEKLFDRIDQELVLEKFRFPSGQSYNGWKIPDKWRVLHAKLYKDGAEVFDGTSHTLGVGFYSKSFRGDMEWSDLQPHLVTNPNLPNAYMFHCAWQYRPWDADWALSVPYRIYREFGSGHYHVELETQYEPGEMIVAHHHKTGRSGKTIIFNAHTCHPHMANDGFAGIAILIRLFQWLGGFDTYYSYRLVLGPEHLGSVFYLRDRPRHDVDRLVCGVFEEMPGTDGPVKVTATFLGDQVIDHAFANVLRHQGRVHRSVAWRRGAGNDETVWEAPGYEVPFVEVTRCEDQWNPYREYHSSLDTPELMDPDRLDEMLLILKKVVHILENNVTIQRRFDGLICLSNPQYDLYMERPDPAVAKELEKDAEKWGHLVDCLFRYMNGDITVLDIARAHELPFDRLRRYLGRFEEKGLVTLKRAEIPRVRPQRVAG